MHHIKTLIKTAIRAIRHKPINAIFEVVAPEQLLDGRTALITGGTSGIGKAIAKLFVSAGAFVVITSRDKDRASDTALQIDPTGTRIAGMRLENNDIPTFSDRVNEIIEQLPSHKLDILVNNAGIIGGDIRDTNESEFDKVLNTNLKSVFFLSKVVAKHMVETKTAGNILNIASSSSLRPAISAYSLSKWGIRGLTEGLAKMLVPYGITVNGIAPGPTFTPMLGKKDYSDVSLPSSPLGRFVLPEEVASMALFLCSSMGRSIVGDIIYMTGGAGVIEISDIDYTFKI